MPWAVPATLSNISFWPISLILSTVCYSNEISIFRHYWVNSLLRTSVPDCVNMCSPHSTCFVFIYCAALVYQCYSFCYGIRRMLRIYVLRETDNPYFWNLSMFRVKYFLIWICVRHTLWYKNSAYSNLILKPSDLGSIILSDTHKPQLKLSFHYCTLWHPCRCFLLLCWLGEILHDSISSSIMLPGSSEGIQQNSRPRVTLRYQRCQVSYYFKLQYFELR